NQSEATGCWYRDECEPWHGGSPLLVSPLCPFSLPRAREQSDGFDEALPQRGLTLVRGLRIDRRPERARHRPGRGQAHDRDQEEVRGEGRPHAADVLRLGERRHLRG